MDIGRFHGRRRRRGAAGAQCDACGRRARASLTLPSDQRAHLPYPAVIEAFLARVDAAAVLANASTAFTDGGQFGMGAEIGISTQKLHARGPMALPELSSYKWLVRGDGQVRD